MYYKKGQSTGAGSQTEGLKLKFLELLELTQVWAGQLRGTSKRSNWRRRTTPRGGEGPL